MPIDPGIIDLGSPHVTALTGCRLWTADSEAIPPPGEPCKTCNAVRSTRKRIVSGGILPGDRLGCAACTCLEPYLERTAHLRGKPPEDLPRPGRPRATLSDRDRRKLLRSPAGRARIAMKDAEDAGDPDEAARLQTLLYRHRDREIGDDELDRLAGTTPGQPAGAA